MSCKFGIHCTRRETCKAKDHTICPYGVACTKCPKAVVPDVTSKTGGAAKALCTKFPLGTCTYGVKCRFSHVVPVCLESATASSSEKDEYEGLIKESQNFKDFMLSVIGEENLNSEYSSYKGFEKKEDQFNGFSENEKKYLGFCFKMIVDTGMRCLDHLKFGIEGEIYDTAEAYILYHQWCDEDVDDDEDEEKLALRALRALKTREVLKREALQEKKIGITKQQACEIEDFAQDNTGFLYVFDEDDDFEEDEDL